MYFWSIVFFLTTTMVMLFKHEDQSTYHNDHSSDSDGVLSAYKLLWKIIRLPNVLQYVIILLTVKVL